MIETPFILIINTNVKPSIFEDQWFNNYDSFIKQEDKDVVLYMWNYMIILCCACIGK